MPNKKNASYKKRASSHGDTREAAVRYSPVEEAGREPTRKKNVRLHQSKIDAAREILGTKTETETIEAALDLVAFREELASGVRSMRGANLVDVVDVVGA